MHDYKFTENWTSYDMERWAKIMYENGLRHDKQLYILELGVFEGRTTTWLADTYLNHKNSVLHCVDSFVGPMRRKKEIAEHNIRECKWPDKVELFVESTEKYFHWTSLFFDVIYIDSCHKYRYVLDDGRSAYKRLNKGGLLIMDDYTELQEVRNACQVLEAEWDLELIEHDSENYTNKRFYAKR